MVGRGVKTPAPQPRADPVPPGPVAPLTELTTSIAPVRSQAAYQAKRLAEPGGPEVRKLPVFTAAAL